MPLLALLAFVIALVLFVVEAVRTKALVAWGFAALTLGFLLLYLVETAPGDLIKF